MIELNEARIVELISSNSDWSILNSVLLNEHFVNKKYNSKEERKLFVDLIKTVWANNCLNADSDRIRREVQIGAAEIYIYGLVHSTPVVEIKKSFKNSIDNYLKDKFVLCEDGFSEWINNSVSFEEKKNLNLKWDFKTTMNFLINSFGDKLFYKRNELEIAASKIKNIEDYLRLKPLFFREYFNEPLGMNAYLYINNPDKENCILENESIEMHDYIRRLIYEAKKSIDYVEKKGMSEIHVVVGCAHEKPLEYLFNNRNILNSLKY